MASFICPHCDAHSAFSVIAVKEPVGGEATRRHGALQCNNADCKKVVGGILVTHGNGNATGQLSDWWPKHIGGKAFPDVPEHIASTADEAHRCLSVGAHRGAVALARAVVEATAKDHGIDKGMLNKKIEALAKQGVISDAMKDAADEIRFAGNEVAHADLAEEPIAADDAGEVLELMDAILTRVYQEPRQVERVRERRKERKGL